MPFCFFKLSLSNEKKRTKIIQINGASKKKLSSFVLVFICIKNKLLKLIETKWKIY